jgi:large subunit ribosomal protein L21
MSFNFANYFLRGLMFAIVTISGQQYKVRKDDEIFVHRQVGNSGESLIFSDVHMVGNNDAITLGNDKKVHAEIIDHLKGDKVIIFKKKRRKGYQKKNGHRQYLTKIKINDIA